MFNFRQAKERGEGTTAPIDDGTYTASLVEVEERTEGGFANKGFRIWKFLADVGGTITPCEGVTGTANTNHPANRSFHWLTAIMGAAPQLGVPIDPIGRKCLVVITQKNGYPTVSDVKPFTEPTELIPGVPR